LPGLARKSEILSSKSETTEFDEIHFEKTKPIYRRAELAQTIILKEIMKKYDGLGSEKTKPNKANIIVLCSAFSVLRKGI
jgi:hypothetical protein